MPTAASASSTGLRRNGLTSAMICTTPVVRTTGDASCDAGGSAARLGSSCDISPSDSRRPAMDSLTSRPLASTLDPGHQGIRSSGLASPPQLHEVNDEEGSRDPGRRVPRVCDRLRQSYDLRVEETIKNMKYRQSLDKNTEAPPAKSNLEKEKIYLRAPRASRARPRPSPSSSSRASSTSRTPSSTR